MKGHYIIKQLKIMFMKNTILIIILSFIFLNTTFSQSKIKVGKTCSYNGLKIPEFVYTFSSDKDADNALTLIVDASGLSKNFKLLAGDVPNACATISIDPKTNQIERYIIYNQTFMNNISKHNNYWASISILAHEIGHHLNGHSLLTGGSRPNLELEADKFSGFILSKLGATLDEAETAVNTLPEAGSLTHPPRSARLAAVANGYLSNNKNNPKLSSTIEIKTSPKNIGWQKNAEKVFIRIEELTKKIHLISQSGYEFNNLEYKAYKLDNETKLFWFPKYWTYLKISDFSVLEPNKLYETQIVNSPIELDESNGPASAFEIEYNTHLTGRGIVVCEPSNNIYFIYDGVSVKCEYLNTQKTEALPKFNIVEDYRDFYRIPDLHLTLDVYRSYINNATRTGKIEIHSCYEERY